MTVLKRCVTLKLYAVEMVGLCHESDPDGITVELSNNLLQAHSRLMMATDELQKKLQSAYRQKQDAN